MNPQQLVRGQRTRLDHLTDATVIEVTVTAGHGAGPVDVSCVALSAERRVIDDRYVVFFNQPASPAGEIRLSAQADDSVTFTVDLERLPGWTQTIVLTATVDGDDASLSTIDTIDVAVEAPAGAVASFTVAGSQLDGERSLILLEIYDLQGWRINAVGQGFAGGLRVLMESFGVEVLDDISSAEPSADPPPDLRSDDPSDTAAPLPEPPSVPESPLVPAPPEPVEAVVVPPVPEPASAGEAPAATQAPVAAGISGPPGHWSETALDLTGGFGSQKSVCDSMGDAIGPQEWALVAAAPGRIDAPELSGKNGTVMVTNHRLFLYGSGGFSKTPRRAAPILATFGSVDVEPSRLSSLPWMTTLIDDQGTGTALYFTDQQVAAAVAEALGAAMRAVRSGAALARPPAGQPWRPSAVPPPPAHLAPPAYPTDAPSSTDPAPA